MRRQTVDLASESIDNELDVLGWDSFDGFLHHMVSILILNTLEHVVLKFLNQLSLLVRQDVFESLVMSDDSREKSLGVKTFCTTRHPYIWHDSSKTRFFIWFAKLLFCD